MKTRKLAEQIRNLRNMVGNRGSVMPLTEGGMDSFQQRKADLVWEFRKGCAEDIRRELEGLLHEKVTTKEYWLFFPEKGGEIQITFPTWEGPRSDSKDIEIQVLPESGVHGLFSAEVVKGVTMHDSPKTLASQVVKALLKVRERGLRTFG
jgi:hypothetical protein